MSYILRDEENLFAAVTQLSSKTRPKNPAITPGFSRAQGEFFPVEAARFPVAGQQERCFAQVQIWHWEQMLLAALSWCSVPEACQELRFLPAWQELGCAACDLSTVRAPVLLFLSWEFGMELVALGAQFLGVQVPPVGT